MQWKYYNWIDIVIHRAELIVGYLESGTLEQGLFDTWCINALINDL